MNIEVYGGNYWKRNKPSNIDVSSFEGLLGR